jgi:acyl-CoA thioester hydrolase
MTSKKFSIPMRVYWQDTDAGGIVYHPNYLNFAQRARSEFMLAFVCKESEVLDKHGVMLVVRHAEIDYRSSARLDDMIEASMEVEKIGNSSIGLVQHITREHHVLATVKITIVAVNEAGRATRIPADLRHIFSSHLIESSPHAP